MKGGLLIFLGIVMVIGAALFGDQVMALFAGMTPLEAMRMIVTFVLHVAVAKIISYAAFTAPELLKPWLRTFRRKRRQARRGSLPSKLVTKMPKVSHMDVMRWLMTHNSAGSRPQKPPVIQPTDDVHLDF